MNNNIYLQFEIIEFKLLAQKDRINKNINILKEIVNKNYKFICPKINSLFLKDENIEKDNKPKN